MSNEQALNSENLVPYSNLNSGFTFGRTTLESTNNSAPDGGSDAASILETAVNGSHEIYDSFSCVSGQQYSFVFYLKANGRTKVIFKPQATSVIAEITFDLTAVTSTVTSGSADSHSITAIGSTWYKCAATVTATATGTGYTQFNLVDGTGASTYTGDISKGVFAWGASVSTCGTVLNETSGSIHREFAPTLKTSQSDQPRFEYSATDGQSEGLLIEASASNLFTYSHELNQWSSARSTVDQNSAIGPTGELTADTLRIDGTDTDSHYIYQTPSVTSGTAYTSSAYVKPAGLTHFAVRFQSAFTDSLVIFNATTGAVTSNSQSLSTSATSVGNGWFRLSATATATSSTSAAITMYACDTDFSVNVAVGDSFRGLLITGLQFEAGASASSLISTSGSTATRAADSCSLDLTGILASGQDVTLYAEGDWGDYTVKPYNRFLATLSENKDADWIALYNAASSGASYIKYENNLEAVQTGVAANGNQKAAVSVAMNSIKHAAAGVASAEDTSANVPPYTQLNIGNNRDAGTLSLDGHCTRVALYGQALSSSELAALTS